MSKETIYPEGVRVFSPKQGAPDFVVGDLVIEPRTLTDWIKANPDFLTDYKGAKQLRLQILSGNKGLYVKVNDYKPGEKAAKAVDDLPF